MKQVNGSPQISWKLRQQNSDNEVNQTNVLKLIMVSKEWKRVTLSYWNNGFTALHRPHNYFNHFTYFNGHEMSLYSSNNGYSDGRETLLYESLTHLLVNINFVTFGIYFRKWEYTYFENTRWNSKSMGDHIVFVRDRFLYRHCQCQYKDKE